MLYHGKSHENGWPGGTPILGNVHLVGIFSDTTILLNRGSPGRALVFVHHTSTATGQTAIVHLCTERDPDNNNVLLVRIEGPVWYTIYHHVYLLLKGVSKPLYWSSNQWEKDIYDWNTRWIYPHLIDAKIKHEGLTKNKWALKRFSEGCLRID